MTSPIYYWNFNYKQLLYLLEFGYLFVLPQISIYLSPIYMLGFYFILFYFYLILFYFLFSIKKKKSFNN